MTELTIAAVILWIGALTRVTRFITSDRITETPRIWVFRHTRPDSLLAYFVDCPWCVSLWLGLATSWIPFVITDPRWLIPMVALTGSQVAGMAAALDGEEERVIDLEPPIE